MGNLIFISILPFLLKYNFFLQNITFSLQSITECSEKLADLTVRTSDRTYPILETFLFLISKLRFGVVRAPEGRENVPENHTALFSKISVSDIPLLLGLWPRPPSRKYNFFLQNTTFFSIIIMLVY